MKKIPAFTVPLYEFTADEQLTINILELAQNQTYKVNVTNKSNVQEAIKSKELINWFNSCLKEIKNDLYDETFLFDIKVTDAWFTKSSYSEHHHLHSHSNSVLSGVFYLTTHEKKAKTKFYLPNPYHHIDFSNMMLTGKNSVTLDKSIISEVQPVAGKLIVFPSNLQHNVEPNVTKENRYTIAFNSFFSGILGAKSSSTLLSITAHYPELK